MFWRFVGCFFGDYIVVIVNNICEEHEEPLF